MLNILEFYEIIKILNQKVRFIIRKSQSAFVSFLRFQQI